MMTKDIKYYKIRMARQYLKINMDIEYKEIYMAKQLDMIKMVM